MNRDDPRSDLEELEELERRRLKALVDGDMVTAEALHADEYELITPGGAALSRAAYLGSIADGSIRYDRFEAISPVRIRMCGESAILRYRVRIDIAWNGGEDHAVVWHTDYWERHDGRWQAVWSHATRIPRAEPLSDGQ